MRASQSPHTVVLSTLIWSENAFSCMCVVGGGGVVLSMATANESCEIGLWGWEGVLGRCDGKSPADGGAFYEQLNNMKATRPCMETRSHAQRTHLGFGHVGGEGCRAHLQLFRPGTGGAGSRRGSAVALIVRLQSAASRMHMCMGLTHCSSESRNHVGQSDLVRARS